VYAVPAGTAEWRMIWTDKIMAVQGNVIIMAAKGNVIIMVTQDNVIITAAQCHAISA